MLGGGGGSSGIGIRSGSYGSLDKQQLQNGVSSNQTARKASKMLKEKEKEQLFLWIFKFTGRKKVGMLFLCLISAVVFVWVLFLWRKNVTFAISKHYRRFDVFVEAEANKAAGKYKNASIDFQIEFYKKEGLTPYTDAKLPLISDVPEGCVIVREHVPISNLFTCLWFNEVDRFTSRDQLIFSTVRDKILSRLDFHFNMFLDCERRNFVIQNYHRDLLLHLTPPLATAQIPPPSPSPPLLMLETSPENVVTSPIPKGPGRRGRDKRSGSKRPRKVVAGSRDDEAS